MGFRTVVLFAFALLALTVPADAAPTWIAETVPPTTAAHLSGVALEPGTGGEGAWAFGYSTSGPGSLPVIFHRSSAGWSSVGDTVPGTRTKLNGGVALNPSDAWAVGAYVPNGAGRALIQHWNGKIWRVFKSPDPQAGELLGVSMSSPTEGWAVGLQVPHSGNSVPLIEHWNGESWAIDDSLGTPRQTQLNSVCQVPGSSEAWAVGRDGPLAQLIVAHYDGSSWQLVSSPAFPSGAWLTSVACVSTDDVWAVGTIYGGSSQDQPLIEHWDGSSWSVVPAGVHARADLDGIAPVPGTKRLWVVGLKGHGSEGQPAPLIGRIAGGTWQGVKLPVASDPLNAVAAGRHGVLEIVGGSYTPFLIRRQ